MTLITRLSDCLTSVDAPMKEKRKANNLLLAKVLYFSNSMGSVAWNRFQNLFFLGKGIHPHQIGQLKSLGLALKVFGEPFFCFIADCTDPKYVFVICIMTQLLSMEILRNVVPLTLTVIMYVKVIRTTTAPATTLTTMASFKLTEGTKEGFGQQRMFGSLAWGIGAWIVGALIDEFGMGSMFYFTYFFQFVSLIIVMNALPSTKMPLNVSSASLTRLKELHSNGGNSSSTDALDDSDIDIEGGSPNKVGLTIDGHGHNIDPPELKSQIKSYVQVARLKLEVYFAEVRQFLGNKSCNFLLINALSTGVVNQIFETYLFISLDESMHTSKGFVGLCTCIGSMTCAPVFYYSQLWIDKYGHSQCILFAEYVFFLRLVLFTVTPYNTIYTKPFILLMHVLHGPSFALFWASSVDAIYKQSPKHLGASCMGVLNMFFNTLGAAIGSLLWGYLYEWFGGMNFGFYFIAILMQILAIHYCTQNTGYLNSALSDKKTRDGTNIGNSDLGEICENPSHSRPLPSLTSSIGINTNSYSRKPHSTSGV
jgi:predicted MFS family arabinose efflux permease